MPRTAPHLPPVDAAATGAPLMRDPSGMFVAPKLPGDHGLLEDLLASVTCTVPLAGAYRFLGSWSVPTRMSTNHVLCVGVAGEADITIDTTHYRLGADSIVLAPARVPQAFRKISSDDLCFYTVHFTALVYGVLDMPSLYGLMA